MDKIITPNVFENKEWIRIYKQDIDIRWFSIHAMHRNVNDKKQPYGKKLKSKKGSK